MWFSEVQMKYSIKHNLNKCQLGPALSPHLWNILVCTYCSREEKADQGVTMFLLTVKSRVGILGTTGLPC